MIFNTDFVALAKNLTPWFLNKPKVKQFLGSLIWGFQSLQNNFKTYYDATDFELNFDGRRIYLEKWLNHNFDMASEGIEINTFQLPTAWILYRKSEGRENYINAKSELDPKDYIYKKTETGNGGVVFEIVVPVSITLTDQMIQNIKTEVDKFSAFGKNYIIRSA